jgi:hypothetical protein
MPTPPMSAEKCQAALDAVAQYGSQTIAAEALGIPRGTLQSRLREAHLRAANLEAPPLGFKTKGFSEYRRTETGGIWQKVDLDKSQFEAQFLAFVEEACQPLKGLAPYVAPPTASDDTLLAVYPIGDHHHGMRADPDETGDAYDCKIAKHRLIASVDYLVAKAPPAKTALLLNLGDYYHINDSSETTPASSNKMDTDNRFGQVFDSGAMNLIACVLRLLEKHETVHVWNMRGNHDPDAAQALSVAMAFYFHAEPRVIVDRGTSLFKFMRFGSNLIASHHGHGTKPEALPLLMAVDRKEDWAATDYRVWHVGHFHHKSVKEHPGCDVEIHRTLAGTDGWHHGKGYRSRREMQMIVYHSRTGEAQRTRFDPKMLEAT